MATNPYVNKVSYNNGILIDISDTTATADKVWSGYKFYGADGSPLIGTASVGVLDTSDIHGGTIRTITAPIVTSTLGQNPVLLKTINLTDLKLSDTSFSSTETAAKSIIASASTGQTQVCNFAQYDFIYRMYLWVEYAHTTEATLKAAPLKFAQVFDYSLGRYFQNTTTFLNNNYNYNTALSKGGSSQLYAYNTSGTQTFVGSTSIGVYMYDCSFGYSNRTANSPTITLYSPRLYFTANNSNYCTASSRATIDAANTTIKWKTELYQVDKNSDYNRDKYRIAADMLRGLIT